MIWKPILPALLLWHFGASYDPFIMQLWHHWQLEKAFHCSCRRVKNCVPHLYIVNIQNINELNGWQRHSINSCRHFLQLSAAFKALKGVEGRRRAIFRTNAPNAHSSCLFSFLYFFFCGLNLKPFIAHSPTLPHTFLPCLL